MLHRMHGHAMVRAISQPVHGETVIEPPPAPRLLGRPPRPGALPPPNPKTQQEGPLMTIPIALILYVLLVVGLGGRLWYARPRQRGTGARHRPLHAAARDCGHGSHGRRRGAPPAGPLASQASGGPIP
jgi:hypothetical protein